MLFPIIKIKDKHTGYEHIVGTDSHDMLCIDNGLISYYNLQTGDGSGRHGSYEFIGEDIEEFGMVVQFLTFDQLKKIYEQETKAAEERERKMKEIIERTINLAFEEDGE